MKKYLSVALLATLFSPLFLSAETPLEDNLKSVMLLFDKSRKESENKIEELSLANEGLSTSNIRLLNDVDNLERLLEELQRENILLRSKISEVAVREFETAALTVAFIEPTVEPMVETKASNNSADEPIPDFTPNAIKRAGATNNNAEHLSDGTILLVNLNTATERELRMLPGVGPVMATRMVNNRPYKSIWDILKLDGVGKQRIEKLAPYITVE